jgi:hypothetical protein
MCASKWGAAIARTESNIEVTSIEALFESAKKV